MKFRAKAAGAMFDPYNVQYINWEKWENTVLTFNKNSPKGINNAK